MNEDNETIEQATKMARCATFLVEEMAEIERISDGEIRKRCALALGKCARILAGKE